MIEHNNNNMRLYDASRRKRNNISNALCHAEYGANQNSNKMQFFFSTRSAVLGVSLEVYNIILTLLYNNSCERKPICARVCVYVYFFVGVVCGGLLVLVYFVYVCKKPLARQLAARCNSRYIPPPP